MKIKSTRLENYAMFFIGNELGGDGANHPLFVGILLLAYGIILTLAILISPVFIILAVMLFFHTKNPFRFRYYKYLIWNLGNDRKFKYRYHKHFTFHGIDIYVLNGYIFAPSKKLKDKVTESFKYLEIELDKISA